MYKIVEYKGSTRIPIADLYIDNLFMAKEICALLEKEKCGKIQYFFPKVDNAIKTYKSISPSCSLCLKEDKCQTEKIPKTIVFKSLDDNKLYVMVDCEHCSGLMEVTEE
jgi:hypothetical protein